MYSMYKQNDNTSVYVCDFICDTEEDIADLPTNEREVYPGSTCIVAATGSMYILNASNTWTKLA